MRPSRLVLTFPLFNSQICKLGFPVSLARRYANEGFQDCAKAGVVLLGNMQIRSRG